jgi:hypothetical protein
MYINIDHNIDWWEGGIEIDSIIRGFCERLGMKESNYSVYNPKSLYLEYEHTTMKQFKAIKRRLANSKKLKVSKKGVPIVIKVEANGVE